MIGNNGETYVLLQTPNCGTIRKNVTVPSWLNDLAEKANANFSQVLQNGFKTAASCS